MKLYASIYIGSYEIILKVFQITQKKRLKELDCLAYAGRYGTWISMPAVS